MSEDLEKRYEKQNRSLAALYTKTLGESKAEKNHRRDELAGSEARYQDSGELGRGAMKRILCSRDAKTKREVAKAILRDSQAGLLQDSFLKEAELTAGLEHPNIVPVHDIGIDAEGKAFFTMKLIGGENLAQILSRLQQADKVYLKMYPLSTLLNIFQKICDAISFAHSRKVLHLDLKPENIQIGSFGEVLVCDWGLARKLEDVDETGVGEVRALMGQTLDGAVKGTPGYMAPEQAAGLNSQRSGNTDIYSLGALLYSLLTYRCPLECQTVEEALEKTKTGDFLRPSEIALVPSSLDAVVLKAMALKVEERYTSVDALKEDVAAYQNGFATAAEEASFFTQVKLFLKRNLLASSLIVGASLLISILTMYFILRLQVQVELAQRAEGEARQAVSDFKRISHDAAPTFYQRLSEKFAQARQDGLGSDVDFTVKLNPAHIESWILKGRYHLSHFEIDAAKNSFEKALELINIDELGDLERQTMTELDSLQRLMVAYRDKHGMFPRNQSRGDIINFLGLLKKDFDTALLTRNGGEQKREHLMDLYGKEYHFISWKGKKYRQFRRNRFFFDLWSEGPDKKDHQYYKAALKMNKDNICNWPNNRLSQVMRLGQLLNLCKAFKAEPIMSLRSREGFRFLNELRVLNEYEVLKNIFMTYHSTKQMDADELFSLLKLFNPGLERHEFSLGAEALAVNSSKCFDLMPLTGMDFKDLDFSGSPVVDLRPLIAMNIEKLNLDSTEVYDFSDVQFNKLRQLNLSGLQADTLRALSAPQLQSLKLERVKLEDWEELLDFSQLTEVKISEGLKPSWPNSVKQRFKFN